jgi:hypothetical protein
MEVLYNRSQEVMIEKIVTRSICQPFKKRMAV